MSKNDKNIKEEIEEEENETLSKLPEIDTNMNEIYSLIDHKKEIAFGLEPKKRTKTDQVKQISKKTRDIWQAARAINKNWSVTDLSVGIYYYWNKIVKKHDKNINEYDDNYPIGIGGVYEKRDFNEYIEKAKKTKMDLKSLNLYSYCINILKNVSDKIEIDLFCDLTRIVKDDILRFDVKSKSYRTGTQTTKDYLTDLSAQAESFQFLKENGYVHRGILHCAKWFDHTYQKWTIEAMKKYKNYDLKIVGHSLGGGTSVLLGMMWKKYFKDRLTVIAYGVPKIMTLSLSKSCRDFVTSFVYGDDLICRLSIKSADQFRKQIGNWKTGAKKDMSKYVKKKLKITKTERTFTVLLIEGVNKFKFKIKCKSVKEVIDEAMKKSKLDVTDKIVEFEDEKEKNVWKKLKEDDFQHLPKKFRVRLVDEYIEEKNEEEEILVTTNEIEQESQIDYFEIDEKGKKEEEEIIEDLQATSPTPLLRVKVPPKPVILKRGCNLTLPEVIYYIRKIEDQVYIKKSSNREFDDIILTSNSFKDHKKVAYCEAFSKLKKKKVGENLPPVPIIKKNSSSSFEGEEI